MVFKIQTTQILICKQKGISTQKLLLEVSFLLYEKPIII